MTHEKRVYSNKIIGGMDFSVPPPAFSLPPPGLPPPVLGVEAGIPVATDYPPPDPFGEGDPYAGGYEPTAEAQWSLPPPSWDQSQPPPIDPYGYGSSPFHARVCSMQDTIT
ncbi:leucine-rich repeat extensin-like protein 3 [Eurytemora carolleeae]|uniref:leucine-rich repeat extensin-like protein 3 n=1 Tax=Eurytemora carolleeae TaxID=1294199 RepID=UPI000C76F85E|nr:leucine-rich repeat extensin-like protein 3 [Eurytemora carolleeae]|eukprot:XP_023348214.1 leucine-rich repeat extensin-like protein 3 [Eurytemora affinis]